MVDDRRQDRPWIFGYEPDAVRAQLREAGFILKEELDVEGQACPVALISLAQSLQLQTWIKHQARALRRLSDTLEAMLELTVGRVEAEREAEHEPSDERKISELSRDVFLLDSKEEILVRIASELACAREQKSLYLALFEMEASKVRGELRRKLREDEDH